MYRIIVLEMDKDYKRISRALSLGMIQVNVFLKHMEKNGHNFDQCVEITEDILNGLKTIKFTHWDENWNQQAEESLKNYTLGNFLIARMVDNPFMNLTKELVAKICEEIKSKGTQK